MRVDYTGLLPRPVSQAPLGRLIRNIRLQGPGQRHAYLQKQAFLNHVKANLIHAETGGSQFSLALHPSPAAVLARLQSSLLCGPMYSTTWTPKVGNMMAQNPSKKPSRQLLLMLFGVQVATKLLSRWLPGSSLKLGMP